MAIFPSTSISSAAADEFDIPYGLKLNDDDSPRLTRVPSSTGNQRTYTVSFWFKIANTAGGLAGNFNHIFDSWHTTGSGGSRYFMFGINSSNQLKMFAGDAGTLTDPAPVSINISTERVLRDVSAWYHILAVVDTPQVTNTNRVKFYINGVQETAFAGTPVWPAQNAIHFINNTYSTMSVCGMSDSSWTPTANYSADGYIAELHFIDGTALTPASFGKEDTNYKHWKPKEVTGLTYGTNGFYLDFASSGSYGTDRAGSNNLSSSGLYAFDQVPDTPTNNFCVWNTQDNYYGLHSFKNGNLWVTTGLASYARVNGTIGVSSGKWYYEMYQLAKAQYNGDGGNYHSVGISEREAWAGGSDANQHPGASNDSYGYYSTDGSKLYNAPGASGRIAYGASYTNGDIVGIAFDLDNNKIWWSKNGVWQASGNPATGANPAFTLVSGKTYRPSYSDLAYHAVGPAGQAIFNFGQSSSFDNYATGSAGPYPDVNDIGSFYYAPPTNFLALCTKNLPEPAIKPIKHYQTMIYDDGAGAKTFTSHGAHGSAGFKPDLVWLKSRGSTYNHKMCDVIQGTGKAMQPNVGDAQITESTGLTSFDADGFTVGADTDYSDTTGSGMVAWCWKLGGTPTADNSAGAGATPTAGSVKIDGSNLGSALAGSIAVTKLSANTTAGISVGQWTGTAANATIAHGLSQAPELVVVHNVDAADSWPLGVADWMDWTEYLTRDSTIYTRTAATMWNSAAPTATVINLGSADPSNRAGVNRFEAYHSVVGYSKIFIYQGTGNNDGTFVWCGFRPAWLMVKNIAGNGTSWVMLDSLRAPSNTGTANPGNVNLWAEGNYAENTNGYDIDILSNGFKLRTTTTNLGTAVKFVFMAFADVPFKYANAR